MSHSKRSCDSTLVNRRWNSCAFRLERLSYDEAYLLHVIFDNGLELHTRSTPGLCEEMWRVFLSWTADIHLIGYPDGIVEELPTLSQRELDERKRLLCSTVTALRKEKIL